MKCKNLRIRTQKGHKYGYCKLYNKEVSVFCNECSFEVKYDLEKINHKTRVSNSNQIKRSSSKHTKIEKTSHKTVNKSNSHQMKRKSSKLAKAEKNRYSIIYQDLTKCCVCGSIATEINEVYEGAYRQSSIKYGMCMPMCHSCHMRFHSDRGLALYYKRMFQNKFVETHSLEEFIEIFKQDYHYTS